MSKLDSSITTLSFFGDNVQAILEQHPEVVEGVWARASGRLNASISVHVSPRLTAAHPLEWGMTIACPRGRNSYTVSQAIPGGRVKVMPA